MVSAGRGFGKTRLGAEDCAYYASCHAGHHIAVVAPTYNDIRGTCFEGLSGLLACCPKEIIEDYNRTRLELKLKNGAIFRGFSADTPDRLRGPQFHRAWCDELAAWPNVDAWDQLQFGLRLGDDPRVVITTTPRPTPLIRSLIVSPDTFVTRGSTFDNAANLAPSALRALEEKYAGTRLGRQELEAEILGDVQGALWTRAMFDDHRVADSGLPEMQRIVVGVDPSGGGDSQGIVVAGKGVDGRYYVIADWTCQLSPAGWGRRVIEAYRRYQADKIVAERNFGGDMVEATIRVADPAAPVKMVTASRGKVVRAEPIAALYEQGRVSHIGSHARLEDQCCSMAADGFVGDGSPDRVDALVWAMTELHEPAPAFRVRVA